MHRELEGAYRTGSIIWLNRKVCREILPTIDTEKNSFVFIDKKS